MCVDVHVDVYRAVCVHMRRRTDMHIGIRRGMLADACASACVTTSVRTSSRMSAQKDMLGDVYVLEYWVGVCELPKLAGLPC